MQFFQRNFPHYYQRAAETNTVDAFLGAFRGGQALLSPRKRDANDGGTNFHTSEKWSFIT